MIGRPRCPRCDGLDVEPCDVPVEASDRSDDYRANFRCKNPRCKDRAPFRYTPPIPGFTGTDVVV